MRVPLLRGTSRETALTLRGALQAFASHVRRRACIHQLKAHSPEESVTPGPLQQAAAGCSRLQQLQEGAAAAVATRLRSVGASSTRRLVCASNSVTPSQCSHPTALSARVVHRGHQKLTAQWCDNSIGSISSTTAAQLQRDSSSSSSSSNSSITAAQQRPQQQRQHVSGTAVTQQVLAVVTARHHQGTSSSCSVGAGVDPRTAPVAERHLGLVGSWVEAIVSHTAA